jgi:hypothetical protein
VTDSSCTSPDRAHPNKLRGQAINQDPSTINPATTERI